TTAPATNAGLGSGPTGPGLRGAWQGEAERPQTLPEPGKARRWQTTSISSGPGRLFRKEEDQPCSGSDSQCSWRCSVWRSCYSRRRLRRPNVAAVGAAAAGPAAAVGAAADGMAVAGAAAGAAAGIVVGAGAG